VRSRHHPCYVSAMSSLLRFHIDIRAPRKKVWEVMLGKKTYEQWTAAFHEGSTYQGSWDLGATIRFVAEDDGKVGGMLGRIAENVPHEKISIEYLGVITNGEDDTTSPEVQPWIGAHEIYRFSEKDGVTSLDIELEGVAPEMAGMFEGMWPKALEKLKEVVER
jgi:uncharacterized protein YndB with AHSA1/START domain